MPSKLIGALKTLACAVAISQLLGCATTNISSVWKDQSYQAMPHKLMIIGIAKKPANKRSLEDEFVKQFKAMGVQALASYTQLPDDKDSDKDAIAAKLKELGADTLLVTRIASRETVRNFAPDVYAPPPYYCTWQGYCSFGFSNIASPGYVDDVDYAIMETNLYDAGNDKLVWSASSETEISGTDQRFIRSYVEAIIKNMVKQKLLQK
jgi:hypothetical protein